MGARNEEATRAERVCFVINSLLLIPLGRLEWNGIFDDGVRPSSDRFQRPLATRRPPAVTPARPPSLPAFLPMTSIRIVNADFR